MEINEVFNVSHFIPIELISRKEWSFYDELVIEDSQVAVVITAFRL